MTYQIQARRDIAADWTSTNPTLAEGEIGYESDTNRLKFGDGTTAWTSLAYFDGNAAAFPIWAEEAAVLADSSYEWAYGNGDDAPSGSGIVVPFACECFAIALDHSTAGSATVRVDKNGSDTGISITTVAERNAYSTVGTPVAFAAGDVVNFYTVTGTGSSGGNRVVAWFRANIGSVVGSNEVTVRKNTGSDVGTRPRLNFIEGLNITLTVTDDATGNEIDITIAGDGNVVGAASSTDNAIPRFDGTGGKTLQNSAIQIDDNDEIDMNTNGINSATTVTFNSEYDEGTQTTPQTVNFGDSNASQKKKITLNTAAFTGLTLTFPAVGNYILKTVNNLAVTSLTIAVTGGVPYYPGASIDFKGDSGATNILSIYYDGTDAYIASVPDMSTTGESVNIT